MQNFCCLAQALSLLEYFIRQRRLSLGLILFEARPYEILSRLLGVLLLFGTASAEGKSPNRSAWRNIVPVIL